MKTRWIRWATFAALVGVIVWIRTAYFTDAARVRRTLRGLIQDASFKADTGNFAKVSKFNGVLARFTDDVTITVEQVVPQAPPLTGRSEVHPAVQAYFSQLSRSEITLHDVVISEVDSLTRTARATFTASAVTNLPGVEFAAQEFDVELRKDAENRWLISKISAVRTLKR